MVTPLVSFFVNRAAAVRRLAQEWLVGWNHLSVIWTLVPGKYALGMSQQRRDFVWIILICQHHVSDVGLYDNDFLWMFNHGALWGDSHHHLCSVQMF